MSKIIEKLHPDIIKKTADRCKERGITHIDLLEPRVRTLGSAHGITCCWS